MNAADKYESDMNKKQRSWMLVDLLGARKSCRDYSSEEVPQEDIDRILWAGGRAPYASGGPRRRIIAVRDHEIKERLFEPCQKQTYVLGCDTIFVLCSYGTDEIMVSGNRKSLWDCGVACAYMDIMAQGLGLGTCWIGHFNSDEVKKVLGCEGRPEIILITGYGYVPGD